MQLTEFQISSDTDPRYLKWLQMYPQFPLYEDKSEDDNCFWLVTDNPEILCWFAVTMKPDEYHGCTSVEVNGFHQRANCFWWD